MLPNLSYYCCEERKKLLLRSITLNAKSNERRQVNEKFHKLERVYI